MIWIIGFLSGLVAFLGWRLFVVMMRERELATRLEVMSSSKEEMGAAFKALSADALEQSGKHFLDLAKGDMEKRHENLKGTIDPVKEQLAKLEKGLREIEKERQGHHERTSAQIKQMADAERDLRQETANLVKALRTPDVRGRWGELQLRRVVEVAGLLSHCDFYEQQVSEGEKNLRPDMVVKLPGGRQVIVDAKVPLQSFVEAYQTEDPEERISKLKSHARVIRSHVQTLGKKAYWKHFKGAVEFVVLFLPAENFFNAALEQDPELIELGAEYGVIIATPTTLIGLLRAIAYGWKEEALSQNAQQVSQLGHELYKRIGDMTRHFASVGRTLGMSVEAYNKTLGSLESRVLVSARKFQELGAAPQEVEIGPPAFVERIPREVKETAKDPLEIENN